MYKEICHKMVLPPELKKVLFESSAEIVMPETREDIVRFALGGKMQPTFDVSYDVPGKGNVREVYVNLCKNGLAVNYDDIYMRRRDPDCMVVADDLPTDKATHEARYGKPFEPIRDETFTWLAEQKELIVMPFMAGNESVGLGYEALLVAPSNASFFAGGLSDLQGFIPASKIRDMYKPRAIIYLAPTFRHTHYNGQQIVVHRRSYDMHEIFSYNLYPGPSAKKGIYGVLLNIGEQENWLTLHAATAHLITPYEQVFTILHEGASGGGKSEMIGPMHRLMDGRVLLAKNLVNGVERHLTIMDNSELCPVTDDMALAHPKMQQQLETRKLVVADAEDGWFLRVNHITKYGTDPATEDLTIHPKKPLIFVNIDGAPGSSILLWEHIIDEVGEKPYKPCPNPRVIMPRRNVPNHVDYPVEVDVRSFGIRTPPCTKEKPSYGIVGMFHVLPPALAWLWRLAAPRGHDNPSIVETEGMTSEGVGSFFPFLVGKMVNQANLLLEQIINTPSTRYILIPNQHIGVFNVGFSGQWVTREFLARRGGVRFREGALTNARCPLLGYALNSMKVDGQNIPKYLLQVDLQNEVGPEAYDQGAKMLSDFFKSEVRKFLTPGLNDMGKKIIDACLNDATVEDYLNFIPKM
ncbi:MAG: DUF4914 family protein [Defluviitaleaceae bacterium]|nr:DUF4914 family protein [Defluviitaleaceae bacterium]